MALDLFLTAVATAFAFVSMVGEGPDPPTVQDYRLLSYIPNLCLRGVAVVFRWNIWYEYTTPNMVPGVHGEHRYVSRYPDGGLVFQ